MSNSKINGSLSSHSWDDLPSAKPKDIYMASVIMAIIALSATIVSAVFIYFGLVVGATRRYFEALMSGRIKWVVAAYSFVCLLLSIASWAIFISFPSALSDADYCPDSFLGTSPLPPQNKYLEYTHLFQLDPFGSPAFFRAMGKSSVMVRDLCRIGDL